MNPIRVLAVCVVSIFITSCVSYTPPVDQSFIPDQNTVVLYGRFEFADNVTRGNPNIWGYQMALNILNKDTQKLVLLRFNKTNDFVSCISIPGGRYQIFGFYICDAASNAILQVKFRPKSGFPAAFSTERNSAIYLGDYSGYAERSQSFNSTTINYGIDDFTNNFLETTRVFHEKYPHLASMPVRSVFELSSMPLTNNLPNSTTTPP